FRDGPLRGELEARGIAVTVLGGAPARGGKPGRLLATTRRVRALARETDVAHTHHLGMLLHGSLAAVPGRSWAWVHTEHTRPDVELTYPRWLVRIGRALLGRPDVLTGVSPGVTAYFGEQAAVLRSRALTIHNAVDLSRFGRPSD